MKEHLKSIIDFEDVDAIFFIGKTPPATTAYISSRYQNELQSDRVPDIQEIISFISVFGVINEVELLFTKRRIYIRKADDNYLVIVLGFITPTPMLQLNCDIVIPELTKQSKPKGLSRFFKK